MTMPSCAVTFTMFAACYLFAGWQSWKLMFLLDPQAGTCPLELAQRRGEQIYLVKVVYLLVWPALMLIGWYLSQDEPR